MPKKIDSKYFTVFYDEKDNNVIDRIIAVIDATYENIISTFNMKKDTARFTIHLFISLLTNWETQKKPIF